MNSIVTGIKYKGKDLVELKLKPNWSLLTKKGRQKFNRDLEQGIFLRWQAGFRDPWKPVSQAEMRVVENFVFGIITGKIDTSPYGT